MLIDIIEWSTLPLKVCANLTIFTTRRNRPGSKSLLVNPSARVAGADDECVGVAGLVIDQLTHLDQCYLGGAVGGIVPKRPIGAATRQKHDIHDLFRASQWPQGMQYAQLGRKVDHNRPFPVVKVDLEELANGLCRANTRYKQLPYASCDAQILGEAFDVVAVRNGAFIDRNIRNRLQFPQSMRRTADSNNIPVVRTQTLGQITANVSRCAKYNRCFRCRHCSKLPQLPVITAAQLLTT